MADSRSPESLLREHVAAFNSGDLRRTMAGIAGNVTWATGTDVIRGKDDDTVAGHQREASIAAFYDFDHGQITRVRVYREGTADA
jgi:hypothetical protein